MLKYCYYFFVILLLVEIYAANTFAGVGEFTNITERKIIRGHFFELTSWTYYTEDRHTEIREGQNNPPIITGLIATTDSKTILIRDLNRGVVIKEIFPHEIVEDVWISDIKMLEFSPNHKHLAIAVKTQRSLFNEVDGMLLVFWDVEACKKVEGEIFLKSCVAISSMNYSPDGQLLCLFIESTLHTQDRETSFQIYNVSGKVPLQIKSAHKKFPFPIRSDHFKGTTEKQLNDSLENFYEFNAYHETRSSSENYKELFRQNAISPEWTEKKLIGATSIISPDEYKAATLYPSGVLHVWNVKTGNTDAKFNFDIQYRHCHSLNDNNKFIRNFHFSHDSKFILLETDESVLVYGVDQNRLVTVCTPPAKKPITEYSALTDNKIENFKTVLYKGKILKLETEESIFIYQISKSNKLLLKKDKKNNVYTISTIFSSTGRYILFKIGGASYCYYELWDNETCRIISLNIRSIDDLYYSSFSQDDKFILFDKRMKESVTGNYTPSMMFSLPPPVQRRNFFRYNISKNKLDPMNELDNIEPTPPIKRKLSLKERIDDETGEIKPEAETDRTFYFNVIGSINNKKELLVEHGNEIIVLSSLTFDLLRRQKIGTDETSEELKRLLHRSEQVDRHQVFIYDDRSRLKQITLRFDVDDYLIINPTNNNVTGSPKGLKRFIPNK